jgi:heterodisulfide reductase subunit C
MPSLRRIIKEKTGQDVSRCQACLDCEVDCPEDLDIPLGSMIQMILFDDDEVLSSRTLWSDCTIEKLRSACQRGLDIRAIMLALREEARNRASVNR